MEDEIDIREYVLMLVRHWRLIVGLTLLAAAMTFAVSLFLPKQYAASATIAITNPRYVLQFDPRIETVNNTQTTNNMQVNAKAYLGLATSDAVLTQLLEAPAVAPLIDGTGTLEDLRRKMLKATAGADPSLVVLKVTDTDPARAAAIANAWAELYVAYIGDVYGQTQQNQASFETQAVARKADYDTAQRALEEFLGNNSVSKLQRQINTLQTLIDSYQAELDTSQGLPLTEQVNTRRQYLTNAYGELVSLDQQQRQIIQDYYGQLTTIELFLSDARALREQVQAGNASSTANLGDAFAQLLLRSRSLAGTGVNVQLQISLGQAAGPVPVSDVDSLINVLASRKVGIQAQIDALLQIFRGETPDPKVEVDSRFGVLESRKAEVKTRIEALTAGLLAGLEVSDASLSNDPVSQLIAQYSNEVLTLTTQLEAEQARQRELTQARDLTWGTFTTISQKVAEARIAAAIGGGEVSLASRASVPTEKVGPKLTQNTALAGAVGLMLSVAAAFGWEWWKGGDKPTLPVTDKKDAPQSHE